VNSGVLKQRVHKIAARAVHGERLAHSASILAELEHWLEQNPGAAALGF